MGVMQKGKSRRWRSKEDNWRSIPALLLLVIMQTATVCASTVGVWVTYPDRSRLISYDGGRSFVSDAVVTSNTITVDENTTYQTMVGFGAALTDSAAWLIWTKLSESQRDVVMQNLFGLNDGNAGISYLRIPLGSSDLALAPPYTYDDGAADPSLARFSISHDTSYIIPLAKQAKTIDSSLKFLGTPWSAPAWMKTSNNLTYGKLNQTYFPVYAQYFRKVYDAYNAQGVQFHAITVQNEPRYEPYTYPGMLYEWYDELNFVRGYLYSAMNGTGVNILTFDHNWSLDYYPKAVMNEGQAYYAGNYTAMGGMHDQYPDKDIYFTECTGTFSNTNFGDNIRYNMQNLFMGGIRNWAKTVLLWSLAQDPTGNPHDGGCANCRGVVTIDQSTGQVTYNEEFYSIAHFARFVFPGAVRIASTDSVDGNFIAVAFLNTDGHRTLVVFNQGTTTATFKVVWNGQSVSESLPASGLATLFWTST